MMVSIKLFLFSFVLSSLCCILTASLSPVQTSHNLHVVDPNIEKQSENKESIQVLVSTLVGSSFLDKRKKFSIAPTATIRHLKTLIKAKYPGSPPIALQKLVLQDTVLDDSTEIGSVESSSLLLDTLSGSGSFFNRTLSLSQTIDAYLATVAQSSFIGNKLHSLDRTSPLESGELDVLQVRNMLNKLRNSFESDFGPFIARAIEREKSPEQISGTSYLWRDKQKTSLSPLMKALAREFDLNKYAAVNLVYFSVLMMVCVLMIPSL